MESAYLNKLKSQRDIITARIQAAEARSKTAERKKETRRKILIGAYYLEQAIRDNQMDALKKGLDGFLTRDTDRKLFDLPPQSSDEK